MNALETPTPKHKLGEIVGCKNGGPPWQPTWGHYRIDGMRLCVEKYIEVWDSNNGPARLESEQPVWEYHLANFGQDDYGNETAYWYGWVTEAEILPAPEPTHAGTEAR